MHAELCFYSLDGAQITASEEVGIKLFLKSKSSFFSLSYDLFVMPIVICCLLALFIF